MSRAALALRVAGGLALGVAWLAWWSPAIVLVAGKLAGARVRFGAVMSLGRALVAIGWPGVASRLYGAEIARVERSMRAARGW